MSRVSVTAVNTSSSSALPLYPQHQDTLGQMNVRLEQMGSGCLPVREGQPDCSYYIRTGQCGYGAACRFNHPLNRILAIATSRMNGVYPQRIGEPECEYYLKTGTCKFGATCKFHHPPDKVGITGTVSLNVLGYPLRPNEIECAYYMRNGECKYGGMCKFHHPQPPNNYFTLRGSTVYPPVQSPTTAQLSFPLERASYSPSPQWESSSNYAPLIMPQGVASGPGWNTYNVGLVSSPGSQQPTARNSLNDVNSSHSKGTNVGAQYHSGSLPLGYYAFQRKNVFPERPGQLECQFYMKTGDCKFGAVCKFHHPRERHFPVPDCALSPKGLPLRPGERLCVFYSRYGICKFGPSCKFDHPMGVSAFNASISSPTEIPAVHRFLASSPGTVALSLSPDDLVEEDSTNNRRVSLSEARPYGDNTINSE